MGRVEGYPDTDTDIDSLVTQIERFLDFIEDFVCEVFGVVEAADISLYQNEFIAAMSGNSIARTNRWENTFG